jgi:hypothetical protein
MGRQGSFGHCTVCGTRSAKSAMAAHLRNCLPRDDGGPTVAGLLIRVQAQGLPHYWIDCVVRIDATLKHLDAMLRRTWLECCGHLSEFSDGTRRRIGMSVGIERALALAGNRLNYEYDFGSTTALIVSGLGPVGGSRGERVRLVARNESPIWLCDECEEPATQICSQCLYEEHGFCCPRHATRHSCGSEMLLPVVNSPRMGVCGYVGER